MANTPTNGDDILVGDNDPNSIDALAGDDTVNGLFGSDSLTGGKGDDQLFGGEDSDVLIGGAGRDLLDGGEGLSDLADYSSAASRIFVDLAVTTAQNTLGAGIDTLASIEALVGTAFNDRAFGNAANNQLNGFGGNDVLQGRQGFDTLFGDQGNDLLRGGASNDRLNGGDGNDTLDGGSGGFDVAEFFGIFTGVTVDLSITVAQNTVGAGIDIFKSIESLSGTNVDDTLLGDQKVNNILGQDGNDNIAGRGGNDILLGNGGVDTVNAGDGDDEIVGVQNRDVLTGGAGADLFRYLSVANSLAGDADRITDFSHAEGDQIDLALITGGAGSFIGAAQFSNVAGEVRVVGPLADQRVQLNSDGDGDVDALIRVASATRLVAEDFIL